LKRNVPVEEAGIFFNLFYLGALIVEFVGLSLFVGACKSEVVAWGYKLMMLGAATVLLMFAYVLRRLMYSRL
jgi:hypothetical protein